MRGKTHCAAGILAGIQLSIIFSMPVSIINIIASAAFSILPDLDKSNSIISGFIFRKKTSEHIYKLLIYTLNAAIFFMLIKMNADFLVSGIISFFIIIIVEKKVSHYHVRKYLVSFSLLLIALLLIIITNNIFFMFPFVVFAVFPWLKHRNFSHSIIMIFLVYIMMKPIEMISSLDKISVISTFSYGFHILCDMFTRQGVALFYPFSSKKISLGYIKVGGKFSNIIEKILVLLLFIWTFISVAEILGIHII